MPWCPKCRSEYREGITECVDCKVALVETLPTKQEEERMHQEEMAKQYQMYAEQLASVQEEQDDEEKQKPKESGKVYQKKADKAEEFKSSAYMLVIVGVLGLIALVLIELHIIPIYLAAPGKYISYTVMGFMFLVFLVCGISSFRSSKKYEEEAKTEEDLTTRIRAWVSEEATKEEIVKTAQKALAVASAEEDIKTEHDAMGQLPEEMMYFQYFDILKHKITAEFGELDADYLDSLCEELYSLVWPD